MWHMSLIRLWRCAWGWLMVGLECFLVSKAFSILLLGRWEFCPKIPRMKDRHTMLEESAIWPGHSGKGEGSKQREGERWSGRETAPRKAPRFVDQTVAVHKYHHDKKLLLISYWSSQSQISFCDDFCLPKRYKHTNQPVMFCCFAAQKPHLGVHQVLDRESSLRLPDKGVLWSMSFPTVPGITYIAGVLTLGFPCNFSSYLSSVSSWQFEKHWCFFGHLNTNSGSVRWRRCNLESTFDACNIGDLDHQAIQVWVALRTFGEVFEWGASKGEHFLRMWKRHMWHHRKVFKDLLPSHWNLDIDFW